MGVAVILSGGMDSTTLLYRVRSKLAAEFLAVSFDYGQRHGKMELAAAKRTTAKLKIPHEIVDLTAVGKHLTGSALTDASVDVPHGHYEAESMKKTVVPGRNTIMLAIAMGIAQARADDGEHSFVFYGAHSGDHAIYPDCRPDYLHAMKEVFPLATGLDKPVYLRAPFINGNKITIIKEGLELGVNYADTYTCYEGREKSCGLCGSCQERLLAFEANGVADPLEYE